MSDETNEALLESTVEIVAAFVERNPVAPEALPGLIASVHAALKGLGGPPPAPAAKELVPAVPVKKSITNDYIICLEDGKKFKSLKRHLRTAYDMSPEEYRTKWGLPNDYPMVAPSYAASRSELAKKIGLGRKG
jgi:predicted transcriptional regulator